MTTWVILGFTSDEIVGAEQDWRLAEECVKAWRAAGEPPGFRILQSGGDGVYMLYWFVNHAAARVLDEQAVRWRDRIVGSRLEPPKSARNALKAGTPRARRHALVMSDLKSLSAEDALTDDHFDRIYPSPMHQLSRLHWTPVAVAKRAVALLECGAGQTILDVGAGVGKFCVVGALTSEADFVGVERVDYLVDAGKAAIHRHRIERVRLLCGDALSLIDWTAFDGIYFFNPFFDEELSIRRAEKKLRELRPGTRVVTYHSFGGAIPDDFRLLAREPAGTDQLEVWQRTQAQEVA